MSSDLRPIPDRFEFIDDEMAAILRNNTGAERLQIPNSLWVFAPKLVLASIRDAHPDWNEETVNRAAARRMSHGAV